MTGKLTCIPELIKWNEKSILMSYQLKNNLSEVESDIDKTDFNDRNCMKTFADIITGLKEHQYNIKTASFDHESSSEISELCGSILSVDRGLVFVAAINKLGRITESKFRSDKILKNLTEEELKMLFMQSTLQASMIKDFDNKLGPFKYTMIEREAITIFVFPFYDRIIMSVSQPYIHPKSLAGKISKIINSKTMQVIC